MRPDRRPALPRPIAPTLAALVVLVSIVATPSRASAQGLPARQVTLFGIVATPGGTEIDEKLKSIAPQLRKLKPGHGFKLLAVESRRLEPGGSIEADFGNGYRAGAELIEPFDADGKVLLRFALERDRQLQGRTIVATPPNQIFFIDQELPDRARLLIGIGAR